MKREEMDRFIQDTIRQTVNEQEPSDVVRERLLANAARQNQESEMVVGSSIPPLVNGLREAQHSTRMAQSPELEMELMEFFGTAQQHLMAVWMLAHNTRY